MSMRCEAISYAYPAKIFNITFLYTFYFRFVFSLFYSTKNQLKSRNFFVYQKRAHHEEISACDTLILLFTYL